MLESRQNMKVRNFVQGMATNLKQHDDMLESRQPSMQQHDTALTFGTEASERSTLAQMACWTCSLWPGIQYCSMGRAGGCLGCLA